MPTRRSVVLASLGGALAGAAAGFSLGLLLAPNEGRQLRDRVAFLLDRWARQVAGLVDQLDDGDGPSEAREKGDALVADARREAQQLLSEADALMNARRQQRAAGAGDAASRAR